MMIFSQFVTPNIKVSYPDLHLEKSVLEGGIPMLCIDVPQFVCDFFEEIGESLESGSSRHALIYKGKVFFLRQGIQCFLNFKRL